MKGIKDMSIYGRIKRKLYYIFAPMKYAQLAGVNFRGGGTPLRTCIVGNGTLDYHYWQ